MTVGHWGNVMPPVLVNNLVPSHTVPAIQVALSLFKLIENEISQRSQSQPSRLAQVPSAPLPPDPPPLYEEVKPSPFFAISTLENFSGGGQQRQQAKKVLNKQLSSRGSAFTNI